MGTRNRVYEAVATIMAQPSQKYGTEKNIERCLVWVLALLRSKESLVDDVVGHIKRDLCDGLEKVSKEPSKRGLLASLLCTQMHKCL